MIVLKGKYNIAKIMLPNDLNENDLESTYKYLDDATRQQIYTFLENPAFKGEPIVIMPDTHYGKGSCVGFTFKFNDYIIPNIVGVDIGCGIMSTKLDIKYNSDIDLNLLDKYIRNAIPAGFSIHDKDTNENEYPVFWEDVKDICNFTQQDYNKVRRSSGTLGGGNHFIELGIDEESYLWLTIHSGSRNFGLQIANYHQKEADNLCKRFFVDFKELNFLPLELGGQIYLDDMKVAQQYAHINRLKMTIAILKFWDSFKILEQIDSVHNYIDMEDNTIRKGATPARNGQKLVIPFNMEDGLIIAEGLGNSEWNNSAPHGAGRLFSRKKAKEVLSLNSAKINMQNKGIFTTSLNNDTLDEVKGAYKDKELIMEMIKPTAKILHFIKPIYNFKAG